MYGPWGLCFFFVPLWKTQKKNKVPTLHILLWKTEVDFEWRLNQLIFFVFTIMYNYVQLSLYKLFFLYLRDIMQYFIAK
jgi:hypothetical protein